MKSLENSMHLYKYHLLTRTLHMLISFFFLRKKKNLFQVLGLPRKMTFAFKGKSEKII